MVINENTQANSSRSLENYKMLAAGSTPGDGAPPAAGNDTNIPPPPADGGDSSSPLPPADTSAAPAPAAGDSTPTDSAPSTDTPAPSNPVAGARAVTVSSTLLLALGSAFYMML